MSGDISQLPVFEIKPLEKKSEFSNIWIQNVLTNYYKMPIVVEAVAFEDSNANDGYLSEIIFIVVKTSDKTFKLVVKFLPDNPPMLAFVKNLKCHRREYMFNSIFVNIQRSRNVVLPIPEMYYIGVEDNAFSLVMENLTCSGYKSSVDIEGFDTGKTTLAFKAIAKVHAYGFMYLNTCSKQELDKLKVNDEDRKKFESEIKDLITSGLEYVCSFLCKEDKLFKHLNKILVDGQYDRFFNRPESIIPDTIIHGDYWSGQTMFNEKASSFSIIDWQLADISCLAIDLTTFLLTSCKKQVYTIDISQVLSIYLQELQMNLDTCGCKLTISRENLDKAIDQCWIYGILLLLASTEIFFNNKIISKSRLIDAFEFCQSLGMFK